MLQLAKKVLKFSIINELKRTREIMSSDLLKTGPGLLQARIQDFLRGRGVAGTLRLQNQWGRFPKFCNFRIES